MEFKCLLSGAQGRGIGLDLREEAAEFSSFLRRYAAPLV
jgi:hypothetical protein